jgi:hypothetical protein
MPLKPFAISRRELFTLVVFVLNLPSDDKEERKKRSALFRELKAEDLKRRLTRVRSIDEIKQDHELSKGEPFYRNPKGAYAEDYGEEESNIRVDLHGSTVDFVIAKLSGKMEGGAAADVLADLCERVVSLRDTNEDRICTSETGAGYRLPRELWTLPEATADAHARAPKAAPPRDEVAAPATESAGT